MPKPPNQSQTLKKYPGFYFQMLAKWSYQIRTIVFHTKSRSLIKTSTIKPITVTTTCNLELQFNAKTSQLITNPRKAPCCFQWSTQIRTTAFHKNQDYSKTSTIKTVTVTTKCNLELQSMPIPPNQSQTLEKPLFSQTLEYSPIGLSEALSNDPYGESSNESSGALRTPWKSTMTPPIITETNSFDQTCDQKRAPKVITPRNAPIILWSIS